MRTALVFALLFLLAPLARPLTRIVVEAGGEVERVWWEDFDGDGRRDLLALVRPEGQQPQLRLHLAGDDGRVRPEEPRLIEAPKDAVLVAVGDLTPDPGREIAFVARDRIRIVPGGGGEPRSLGPIEMSFDRPDDDGIASWPHVFRPAEGERDALLVPVEDGYEILRFGKDGIERRDRVRIEPERSLTVGSHDLFAIVTEIPAPRLTDYDGDGRIDVMAVSGGELAGYLQSRKGAFPSDPTFSFRMSFLDQGAGTTAKDAFVRYLVELGDIDGDRRADLLVTRTRGKLELFGSFESQHFHYRGPAFFSRERNDLVSPPSGLVAVAGVSVNPTLLDFDGDGHRDLIVTAMKADVVGQHLLKRVNAEYRAYLYDPRQKTFQRTPAFSVARRYPLWRLEYGQTDRTVFFAGDFDGDGQKDLLDVSAGGEARIEIRRGESRRGGRFEFRRTILTLAGDVTTDVRVLDVDGDGRDDFLLHGKGQVFLFYSRR